MRRLLLLVLVLCAGCAPAFPVLEAQSLPISKIIVWDPNPAADEVTSYAVVIDGAPPVIVQAGSCTTECTSPWLITATGAHTIQLTATNDWGTGVPASLTVTVRVPGKSNNLRIR